MLSPTSMSAMSIERISKAVPASSPFSSTRLEIESGFSSTCLCVSAEPMAVTMPSPTRAMIVSSVGTADQPVDVGADGDPGLHLELDAVLGHAVDRLPALGRVGAVDHLRD